MVEVCEQGKILSKLLFFNKLAQFWQCVGCTGSRETRGWLLPQCRQEVAMVWFRTVEIEMQIGAREVGPGWGRGKFKRINRIWWWIWCRGEDKGEVKDHLEVSQGGHTHWDGNRKRRNGVVWGRESIVLGPDGDFEMRVWHWGGTVAKAGGMSVQSFGLTKSHIFKSRAGLWQAFE